MLDLGSFASVLYFFVPAYLANMSPVLVRGHFEALAKPIDCGRELGGKRILGDHKTWRGLLAAVVTGVLVFEVQRLPYQCGVATSLASIDYAAHPVLPGFLMGFLATIGVSLRTEAPQGAAEEHVEVWRVVGNCSWDPGESNSRLPGPHSED